MTCGKCKVCGCKNKSVEIFESDKGHHAYTEDGVIIEGKTEEEVQEKISERGQLNG